MLKDFYTVKDIAEQMQTTRNTVRRLIRSGVLPSKLVAQKYIVTAEALYEFMHNNDVTQELGIEEGVTVDA